MGTVYLGALALGRPSAALPSLAAATLAILVLEPRSLFSASLQLSVAAVAGMVAFAGPVTEWLHRWLVLKQTKETAPAWLWSPTRALALAVGVSLAAMAGTAPLIALLFGRVPLLGLPATLLALPPTAPAIVLSGLAGVVGALSPTLGEVVGWLARLPLSLLIVAAEALRMAQPSR
jgi:competence protein ComEC